MLGFKKFYIVLLKYFSQLGKEYSGMFFGDNNLNPKLIRPPARSFFSSYIEFELNHLYETLTISRD